MNHGIKRAGGLTSLMLGIGALIGSVGCQVEMGGQTLPSPYYRFDDVQYHAPGPEFKLTAEAAAMQAAKAEALRRQQ